MSRDDDLLRITRKGRALLAAADKRDRKRQAEEASGAPGWYEVHGDNAGRYDVRARSRRAGSES